MTFQETVDHDRPVKTSSDRTFGVVFSVVFAIIATWPLIHDAPIRWWSAAVAIGLLGIAYAAPSVLTPFNRAWMAFGLLLHKVISPIIIGIIFFVAVTPLALLMRLLGKVPLQLRFDPKATSYWIVRTPPGPAGNTMKDQF